MKYSYHWLKSLSGTKKTADRVAQLLMTHAFEVEAVESYPHGLSGVVIGQVVSVEPHPDADRLRVTQVEIKKGEKRQIVCGAPNVALGQKVAVILPGSTLPDGTMIKSAEIRGVRSEGMICSEKELGLSENHSGILVLDENAPIGAEFVKYVGLADTLLDVKILPDRGSDALSYQGLAREIAALDGHAPQFSDIKTKPFKIPSYNRAPKITIADKKACLRYIGLSFQDVTVGESPLWLKTRLLVSGIRPINVVVDITNYFMLLFGQPIHAFDADTVSGAVTVRFAKKNEKLELLNGEKKTLTPEDVVIADAKHALALAGVMGGKESSITSETKNIFLEIATFDGATIRRTRTRHGLSTDASYRFERNLDPNMPGEVAREAVELLRELAGAKLIGARDIYPEPRKEWKVELPLLRVEQVLGVKVPLFEVVQYLALDGLSVKKIANKDALMVTIPTRRQDLRDEWDLIEEVGRMRGYEKIPAKAPEIPLESMPENTEKKREYEAKSNLAHLGFSEIMNYSFYGERERDWFSLPENFHVELDNPLTPDQKYLRLTLLPLFMRRVKENLRHTSSFDVFEWGSVFRKSKKEEVLEEKRLAVAMVGYAREAASDAFLVFKGRLESFFSHMGIQGIRFMPHAGEGNDIWHRTRSADVFLDKEYVGTCGELLPAILSDGGISTGVMVAELQCKELLSLPKTIVFEPLPKYPFATRDISLVFPSRVTAAEAEEVIRSAGSPLLKYVELFDVFDRPDGRNLAFHLAFGMTDRTLTGEEMEQAFQNIVSEVKIKLHGELHV